jgi:hypothetical protein
MIRALVQSSLALTFLFSRTMRIHMSFFFGDYLIFLASGCYVLVARWKQGAELYPFAVGR